MGTGGRVTQRAPSVSVTFWFFKTRRMKIELIFHQSSFGYTGVCHILCTFITHITFYETKLI